MFTLDGIRKFHHWMHASISLLLGHLSTLPAEYLTNDVPNFGFSTLQKQMIHILNCEGFWVSTLQGLDYSDRDPAGFPEISDVVRFQKEICQRTLQ